MRRSENQLSAVFLLSLALFLCTQRVIAQQTPAIASSPNGSPSPTPPVFSPQTLSELKQLQKAALEGDYAYRQVAHLANNIGPRLSGSAQAAKAVEYVAGELKALGCNVQIEKVMSSNPVLRQKDAPSLAKTDEVLDKFVEQIVKTDDANDVLYALEASHDYDPGPNLEKIQAPLLAINSADDLINPPELGILEREMKRVPHGRTIVIPLSDKTRGHGSHTIASLWRDQLVQLLRESERSP